MVGLDVRVGAAIANILGATTSSDFVDEVLKFSISLRLFLALLEPAPICLGNGERSLSSVMSLTNDPLWN